MKNVMITGANRGLGKELVKKFAAEGYSIYACARKQNKEFEAELQNVSTQYGVMIIPVYFDMLNSEEMKREIKTIYRSGEKIDVLINNAGIAHGGLFRMTSVNRIKQVFDVNLFSLMELTQLVSRGMEKKRSGCIINIASIAGIDLAEGNCAYGVSKAAVIAFTKTLAAEFASCGIRVNAVAPGLLNTDMAEQMEEKAYMDMIQNSLMQRLGEVGEVADAIVYLASDKASFINGQVIRVDGGKR